MFPASHIAFKFCEGQLSAEDGSLTIPVQQAHPTGYIFRPLSFHNTEESTV